MDADEKLVRETWERALICEKQRVIGRIPQGKFTLSLGGRGFTRANVPDPCVHTEAAAWAAAAEFTRDLLEEIRKVEMEIAFLVKYLDWTEPPHDFDEEARLGKIIVDRILAREQAALDALKHGMRPTTEASNDNR